MIAVGQIALSYVAVACIFAGWSKQEVRRSQAALRGGWFAAFVLVVGLHLGDHRTVREVLPAALAVFLWCIVCVSARRSLCFGGLALVAEAALRERGSEALLLSLALLMGGLLASLMRTRRWPWLRIFAFWSSFIGTFAWLLPTAIVESTCNAGSPRLVLAVVASSVALLLAGWATVQFQRAGGTPEPLDPPLRLVTGGLYAWLRHPILISELLCVLAGWAFFPQRWVALYVLVFAIALIGPARLREQRRLEQRFGAAYREWHPRFG